MDQRTSFVSLDRLTCFSDNAPFSLGLILWLLNHGVCCCHLLGLGLCLGILLHGRQHLLGLSLLLGILFHGCCSHFLGLINAETLLDFVELLAVEAPGIHSLHTQCHKEAKEEGCFD